MIDIKKASDKAIEHLESLYPDKELGNILLEEAELSDDGKFWQITVSFKRLGAVGGVGESVFVGDRSYKVFTLLADTGEVRSMKNRIIK